jgi:hypothetical protein
VHTCVTLEISTDKFNRNVRNQKPTHTAEGFNRTAAEV